EDMKAFAQFIAVCSSSILVETLGYAGSFSSLWRGKRRVFEQRKPLIADQIQPSTNADKLSGRGLGPSRRKAGDTAHVGVQIVRSSPRHSGWDRTHTHAQEKTAGGGGRSRGPHCGRTVLFPGRVIPPQTGATTPS